MTRTPLLSLGIWSAVATVQLVAVPLATVQITAVQAGPVSRQDPEPASNQPSAISTASGSAVVVTAHPLASQAALETLRAGGQAVDAVVAAQAVLAVVEPQSSGLGGGGFLLHWNAERRQLQVLDGRETAPLSSRADDLLDASGRPLPWLEATRSLHSIGIPGTVALLWEAHQQHGRRPWKQLLTPAIALARDGFMPSPRLLQSSRLAKRLGGDHNTAFQQLYLPGGKAIQAGQRLRNPALAHTLEHLADHGGSAFYRGALAHQILRELASLSRDEPRFRGWSAADLAGYQVIERRPLCSDWRGYRLCSVPAPSSGGLALQQSLALWEALGPEPRIQRPAGWQRLALALAWADADRLYWVRDPVDGAPWIPALLKPAYIRARAMQISRDPRSRPVPGLPPGQPRYPFARAPSGREDGTTQITVVDADGNLASYTASVETVFGSRHLVAGMVMNNQLTDFSFRPSISGLPIANQRRAGRRPVSSMAPTIVLREGIPVLAVGSPGGRRIPHYLSRTLLAALVWQEPPERSVALPHLSVDGDALVIEREAPLDWPTAAEQLATPGQALRSQRFGSGTALLQRINGRWYGAADPRREGRALALP